MVEVVFGNKKPDLRKMLSFGFKEEDKGYVFQRMLCDGAMTAFVTVSFDSRINTEIIDNVSGEEYVLHTVSLATGAFVGKIRAEYSAILDEIAENCCDVDVFTKNQTAAVIEYIRSKYSCEPEYLWKTHPDNAIFRRSDNGKWFVALLKLRYGKLGFDSDETVEIINLRVNPEELRVIVDNKRYFPGFHMNKKHWVTVCLDGSLPLDEIFMRIDNSFVLADKK